VLLDGSDRKTVLLLGAGASRGAISHVLHNQKRIKPPLNGDFFKVAATYARAEGASSAARRRLDRLQRAFKLDLPVKGVPTMEEAFSLLYIAKDFPEIYKTGPGRREAAGVRKEIDDFLKLLFPILTMLDRSVNGPTGYDRLVSRLSSSDTIITLNYDTMLDSALHRRGWNPANGYALKGTKGKCKWKPVKLPDGTPAIAPALLKVHGSANWFVRGDVSTLSRVFSSKPVRITQPRENGLAKHVRQVVPPMFGKLFDHDHWRSLWTNAYKALCEAEVLVVVGCSLVDTDFHLRAFISRVVRYRKDAGDKFGQVILVNQTKTRRKWKTVLKGSFAKSDAYNRFDKFLTKGLSV